MKVVKGCIIGYLKELRGNVKLCVILIPIGSCFLLEVCIGIFPLGYDTSAYCITISQEHFYYAFNCINIVSDLIL